MVKWDFEIDNDEKRISLQETLNGSYSNRGEAILICKSIAKKNRYILDIYIYENQKESLDYRSIINKGEIEKMLLINTKDNKASEMISKVNMINNKMKYCQNRKNKENKLAYRRSVNIWKKWKWKWKQSVKKYNQFIKK